MARSESNNASGRELRPEVIPVVGSPREGKPPLLTAADFERISATISSAPERGFSSVVIVPIVAGTFSGGADLDDLRLYSDAADTYLDLVAECWRVMETSGVPVVAAVGGPAVGAAFELCLCADAVVATENAWFALPETRFGIPPLSAARRLAASIGATRARETLLSGNRISAVSANTLGLVTRVVSSDDLVEAAVEVAGSLFSVHTAAIAAVKAALTTPSVDQEEALRWLKAVLSERSASDNSPDIEP